MKTALLFHRLGPYHVARLEAAARHAEITALELSAETGEYAWDKVAGVKNFQRLTLFPEGDSRAAHPREVQERVSRALSGCHPQVVAIPGWSDPGALAALDWCLRTQVPAVLMSESTAHDAPRSAVKEWIKGRIVGLFSAALVGGRAHADYLRQLGFPSDRVFTGYDVVDNEHFSKAEKLKLRNAETRSSEIPGSQASTAHRPPSTDAPYFLASARFLEKKNLPVLLQAYAEYRAAVTDAPSAGAPPTAPWSLVLLGDGPLRSELCRLISDLSLHDCVHLPGFKQYDELPEFYARASAFVHASTSEQWGLVVNEAMAAGLPVLVSNRCGCAPDLVQEGVNGFTFDPYNVGELADLMLKISFMDSSSPPRPGRGTQGEVSNSVVPLSTTLAQFGAASQRIIAEWGPERFALGLSEAARNAIGTGPVQVGWGDALLLGRLINR